MIHIVKPYSLIKDLGHSYNEEMKRIPQGHWAVLCDLDTMFLTSDAGHILFGYAERNPDAGILTCWTNRIHPLGAHRQLLTGQVSNNFKIDDHVWIAEKQREKLYKVSEIKQEISGFLMMVKKETWDEVKFPENGKCLGIDNAYSWRILESGRKILRMDGLYVFHGYRIKNGITNKDHLKA